MNPLKAKNVVASILQLYAWANAVCWISLVFILADTLSDVVSAILCSAGLVVSFAIYALGEVVELLNQIKINTDSSFTSNIEELPEI